MCAPALLFLRIVNIGGVLTDLADVDADHWREWWDVHIHEYLTPEQLASVQASDAGDPVEATGVARFGPLFPSGPDVHLSAVHELLLPPQGF